MGTRLQSPSGGATSRRVAAAIALALVAPATVFFAAAIARSLQPVAHEPARTLSAIVDAFLALPPLVLLGLVGVAPVAAIVLAAIVVWRTATADSTLREDVRRLADAGVPFLRRPTLLVALVVLLLGLAVISVVTVHTLAG